MTDGFYLFDEDTGTWWEGNGIWAQHMYCAFRYDSLENAKTGKFPFRRHNIRIIEIRVRH